MKALALAPLGRYSGYATLILRVVVGLIFLAHGWSKLQSPDGTASFFANSGIPMAAIMVWVVIIVEAVGGISQILGLLTRLWGVLQAITMLVAMVMVTVPNRGLLSTPGGQGHSELEFLLMASAIALALTGAGKLSLDERLGLNAAD